MEKKRKSKRNTMAIARSNRKGASLFWVEFFGFIGGALITLGFIPQVVRVMKLKSAYEISLPFTLLFLLGGLCWLIYGVLLELIPVVLWNGITLVILAVLLCTKLKYGMKK